MTGFFDKLNLRPAERRVLVGVALAVFVVINMLWIWPRFGDWSKAQTRSGAIEGQMQKYHELIKDKASYEELLKRYGGDGAPVPADDQVTTFIRTYQSQAAQSGVMIPGTPRTVIRTNENFIEHAQTISVSGDEAALVNFIYSLGTASSGVPIRVKELSLQPIPPLRQKLQGQLTIVASFQRKLNPRAPVPSASAPAATSAAPGRPVVAPVKPASTNATPAKPANTPAKPAGAAGIPAPRPGTPAAASPSATNKPPTLLKK